LYVSCVAFQSTTEEHFAVNVLFKKQTKERRLPDIIGIGVEKCGTHALTEFLNYHPLIRINKAQVEAHYFERSKPSLGLQYYR